MSLHTVLSALLMEAAPSDTQVMGMVLLTPLSWDISAGLTILQLLVGSAIGHKGTFPVLSK